MAEMESELQDLLPDPQTMEQLMGMARLLGAMAPPSTPEEAGSENLPGPGDGLTREQRCLLEALKPYLAVNRLEKLEKAMRAAKMARFASAFLGSGGLQLLTGR